MVTKTNKGTIVWVLVLTVCIGGCATPAQRGGKDFNEGNIPKIVIGKTTKSDVSNYLGSPLGTQRGVDGSETWTYNYRIVKSYISIVGTTYKEDRIEEDVVVQFGNNGVVKECSYGIISYKGSTPGMQPSLSGTGSGTQSRTRCQDVR